MGIGLLGEKIGMTRVFDEKGNEVPVTVIQAGPCRVIQVKTKENDGYESVQLGFKDKRENLLKKPEYYHLFAHKAKLHPKKYIREFRTDDDKSPKTGKELTVTMFSVGDKVQVSGISKGRGFQGVVKRWAFKGGKATHGAKTHRQPGSIGMSADPARVLKGKKMPGRMGGEKVTVTNLEVIDVLEEKNILLVKGAVPGSKGGLLKILPKEDA